jgi:ribosomal protein S18 acetylase RimI-like enzyme
MPTLLDNIFWHALTGPQAAQATGAGAARRYAQGFAPLVAFADAAAPDFSALAPYCVPGEALYVGAWSGPVPAGWQLQAQATMWRMVWNRAVATREAPLSDGRQLPAMVALGPAQVPQMLALTALTQPGPFGPRTWALGDYLGCFEGDRLVAMAGERAHAGPWREVSGVCTHPDFQGHGLAGRLVLALVRRQLARGETPFLHVMSHNTGARALYARMGFQDQAELVVRVVSRL